MKNSTKMFLLNTAGVVAALAGVCIIVGMLIIAYNNASILGNSLFSSGLVIASIEALCLGLYDLKKKGEAL